VIQGIFYVLAKNNANCTKYVKNKTKLIWQKAALLGWLFAMMFLSLAVL